MTNDERAKALVNAFRKTPSIPGELETLARLALRAAAEDERHDIVALCLQFADTIDRSHGGAAIRELANKIRERSLP